MKQTRIYKTALLFLVSALLFSGLGIAAGASEERPLGYMLEETQGEYHTLIREAYAKRESVVRGSVEGMQGAPVAYSIDLDTVIVEYEIDNADLSLFEAEDNQSFLPQQYKAFPVFYVPIYGTFGDTQRIFGHIQFRRMADESGYLATPVITGCDEAFRSGQRKHFLERLMDHSSLEQLVADRNLGAVNEIVLVNLSAEPMHTDSKIAMIETDTGVYVWDFTGAAHSETEEVLYSVDDFISLRGAYETQRSDGFADVLGRTVTAIAAKLLVHLLLVAVGVTVVVVVIVWCVRKAVSKGRAGQLK